MRGREWEGGGEGLRWPKLLLVPVLPGGRRRAEPLASDGSCAARGREADAARTLLPHPPSSAALFYDECVERLHDVALHARRRAEGGGERFTAGVE